MTNDKIQKAINYLDNAKTVALVCHINPDGDAIGSVLAFSVVLEKLGKTVGVFCDNLPPKKFEFLQNFDKFNVNPEKKFDLAVAVDCSDLARTGECGKYFKHAKETLSVDHHKTNQSFTDYVLCEINASATAELLFDIITELEKNKNIKLIDDKVAEALFLAIVTDSGAFSFSNVTSKTHLIASELVKYNFNPSGIIYDMISAKSKNVFSLSVRVLNKVKFYFDNRLAIITFTKDDFKATDTSNSDTEGIITNLINISEVKIAVALTEDSEKYYKVSVRTKEPVDAADFAVTFGGGGHNRAAGFRLNGFYEDVIEKLLKAAGDRL